MLRGLIHVFPENMQTCVEARWQTCVSNILHNYVYMYGHSIVHSADCAVTRSNTRKLAKKSDLPELFANLIEASTIGIAGATREANHVIAFATTTDRTYKNTHRFVITNCTSKHKLCAHAGSYCIA